MISSLAAIPSSTPIAYLLVGGIGVWAFLAYAGSHFKRFLLVLRILETSRVKARHHYEEVRDYMRRRMEVQMGMGIDSDRAARILESMASTSGGPPPAPDLSGLPDTNSTSSSEEAAA